MKIVDVAHDLGAVMRQPNLGREPLVVAEASQCVVIIAMAYSSWGTASGLLININNLALTDITRTCVERDSLQRQGSGHAVDDGEKRWVY
jgi:hypothetical protein